MPSRSAYAVGVLMIWPGCTGAPGFTGGTTTAPGVGDVSGATGCAEGDGLGVGQQTRRIQIGDVAGFAKNISEQLVKSGSAEFVEAEKAPVEKK